MGAILRKSSLLNMVRQTLISEKMIRAGDGVILAVSGGPDSVALTHVMVQLREEFACWFVIAHLDHCVRKESVLDFEFAKSLAESLGIEFYGKRVDVGEFARQKKISAEQAGRIIRYDFLEAARIKFGANKIATAHNADDVIETFLFRLFQGSSLTGLSAIRFRRGNIIRPLLKLSKAEIIEFLTIEEKNYVIDRTNLSSETDRNFIRNRFIPLALERFPNFKAPLLRTIDLIQEDEQYLDTTAHEFYTDAIFREKDRFQIDVQKINSLPVAISSRIVRTVLFDLSGPNTRWTRFHIDRILGVLKRSKPFVRLNLPYGLFFIKDYGTAGISRFKEQTSSGYCLDVTGPGRVQIPGSELFVEFKVLKGPTPYPEFEIGAEKAYFDANLITFPFALRPYGPGDRIIPWGKNSPVKIKKLFIDAKILRMDRYKLPLVFKDGKILWIPGVRRCAGYGIGRETKSTLEISLL